MIAQLRKVRFISADSASQASRSSPSMSSSNKLVERKLAARDPRATSPRPQTASAYSLATKPSGRSRARSSRRVSSMPSV